ncbi:response regulator [Nitrospira sp. M1]
MKTFHEPSLSRILIVEDDPDIRLSLQMLLEFQGYVCSEAEHERIAMNLLRTHEYDAIITDYHMPLMDGLTLIKNVMQYIRDAPIPILLFSCSLDRSVYERALQAGAYAVLQKPYNRDELLEIVQRALACNACSCS